jgi:predicted nucleic acid-binding protein
VVSSANPDVIRVERVDSSHVELSAVGLGTTTVQIEDDATLYRQLRQQGTPMPTNDLWIAALVIEQGASLCTCDAHFKKLAQLDVV